MEKKPDGNRSFYLVSRIRISKVQIKEKQITRLNTI